MKITSKQCINARASEAKRLHSHERGLSWWLSGASLSAPGGINHTELPTPSSCKWIAIHHWAHPALTSRDNREVKPRGKHTNTDVFTDPLLNHLSFFGSALFFQRPLLHQINTCMFAAVAPALRYHIGMRAFGCRAQHLKVTGFDLFQPIFISPVEVKDGLTSSTRIAAESNKLSTEKHDTALKSSHLCVNIVCSRGSRIGGHHYTTQG